MRRSPKSHQSPPHPPILSTQPLHILNTESTMSDYDEYEIQHEHEHITTVEESSNLDVSFISVVTDITFHPGSKTNVMISID
jgi:hypothetical protein